MWEKMTHEIREVAKETLGESRGFGPRDKKSRWLNKSVQSKVRIKKECFVERFMCKSARIWKNYNTKERDHKGVERSKIASKFLMDYTYL